MKKIIYIIFSLALTSVFAQERNVYWVHGMGEDINFWDRQYANTDRAFRINPSGFTYRTDEGVQRYADRIRTGRNITRDSRSIAIGHSMGGVAIREIDRDNNELFGGMITVGAPLDGAKLANEAISGGADRFVRQSIDQLRRGPIASRSRSLWRRIIETIGAAIRGYPVTGLIRGFGNNYILNILEDVGGRFEQQVINNFDPNNSSVRDLAENSAYMRSIRSFRSAQPKILAWGDEDSPVHARLLASSMTLNESTADEILSAYNEIGNLYKISADGINIGSNFGCIARGAGGSLLSGIISGNPVRGAIRGVTSYVNCRRNSRSKRAEKEAWNAGADYIRRGWEIAWNRLTGATYLEHYTATERVRECRGGSYGPAPEPVESELFEHSRGGNRAPLCAWVPRRVRRSRWVNGPSDGLIKRSSQIGQQSSWRVGTEVEEVRLDGVNHFEMGHSGVDRFFERAFRGLHGRYFRTASRY